MMRGLMAGCFGLLLACCSSSSGEPRSERAAEPRHRAEHTREEDPHAADREVAQRVRTALLEEFEGASVLVLDEDTLAIVRGGVTAELELDAVQRQCRADHDACDAWVARLVAAVVEAAPVAPAIERTQVRAVLHDAAWLRDAGSEPAITRPFVGDLSIVYVLDFPTTIAALTGAQRFELAIGTDADLHALALQNMARDLAEFPIEPLGDEAPGVFALRAGDSYEAARVLLHERWTDLASRVEGDLLIGIPSRDLVLFAGSAHPAHVSALRRNTQHLARTLPHPLSARLYRLRAEGWEPYAP